MKQILKYGAIFLIWSYVFTAQSFSKDDEPRFLFVQNAKSMRYSNGELELQQVSPMTVFFSDRPKRIAGHMRTDHFLKIWNGGKNSFKRVPPNATLSVFNKNSQAIDVVLALSEPRISGDKVIYKAKVLLGTPPESGGENSLFIDSSEGACDVGDPSYSGLPCWAQTAFDCPGRGGC